MRWFGPFWEAPICMTGEHVETPVWVSCEHCQIPIEEGERGVILAYRERFTWRDFPVHLDCLMEMTQP